MTAIEKLKHLKYILDWNLNLKSMDILPTINEVIAELEQPEVTTVQKEANRRSSSMDKYTPSEVKAIEVIEEINQEKTIEELRKEYTEKFSKKPFGGWDRDVLISKLS